MTHNAFEALPFIGIILSISFWPLINKDYWHKNVRAILLGWISFFCIMEFICHGAGSTFHIVLEALFKHYIPFILLISSLFIITGGIYVDFPKLKHGALSNTLFLFIGSLIAGWIGTTGAAALLIRPFLRLNEHRNHRTHLVIFYIFLVANIGGIASPIGDPPLFIGYLEGIKFFWPIQNLWPHLIGVLSVISVLFYFIDKYYWSKEIATKEGELRHGPGSLISLFGKRNIILLIVILSCLILCNFDGEVTLLGISVKYSSLLRDSILALVCIVGSRFPSKIAWAKNNFSYEPLVEVIETFFAIFITVAPLLSMLSLGKEGPFACIFNWISQDGTMDAIKSFWSCGLLSLLLDNSPTFLIFFYMAGGDAASLMTEQAHLLKAILIPAVFFGAVTYIGNAPNFVIKSIAISNGIDMPSFLKYALIASCTLLPIFWIVSLFL